MPVKKYKTRPADVADTKYAGGKMFDNKGIKYRYFKLSPDAKSVTVDADKDQLDILESKGYS